VNVLAAKAMMLDKEEQVMTFWVKGLGKPCASA
jgi:hypothetical protein